MQSKTDAGRIITDSNIGLDKALSGISIPASIKKRLAIIDVLYYSFDGKIHKGQLVADKELSDEIKEIFESVKESRFPVGKIIPISEYNWSDSLSMMDNNTSCFNYRVVKGTKILSLHAKGRAIDLNPALNPAIKGGKITPPGSSYNTSRPGTVINNSPLLKIFEKKGWIWGGKWRSLKDYQHFEKK
ncbi:MAG: M15 family metallopeptidase [Syntrophothermus sp.]